MPQASQDLYMQNIGDEQNKNWIACIDLDCFISQGGTKPAPKEAGQKRMTPEQLFNYKKEVAEKAWEWAKEKAGKEIPVPVAPTNQPATVPDQKYLNDYKEAIKERRILSSVFFYGVCGGK